MAGKSKYYRKQQQHQFISGVDMREKLGFSEEYYKDLSKRFNEIYEGKINLEDFKQNNRYKFDKRYSDLIAVLLDTLPNHPEYNRDKNKQIYSIEYISNYNKELLQAIDKFIGNNDNLTYNFIKNNKSYINCKYSIDLVEQFIHNINYILNYLHIGKDTKRVESLTTINHNLEYLKKHTLFKCVEGFMEVDDNEKDYIHNIVNIDKLEDLIIALIYGYKNNKLVDKDLEDMIKQNKVKVESELDRHKYEVFRESILDIEKNKKILDKVTQVLDTNDPLEKLISVYLKEILINETLRYSNNAKINNLTNLIFEYDCNKILRKFNE